MNHGSLKSAFQPGHRIGGRYEVHEILGGGMGQVYVVYDHKDGDVLALKTHQSRCELEQHFEKEALAWIKLERHPNIVRAR